MPDEQIYAAAFPVVGVDVTCEYGRQPDDSTPAGANVRTYAPLLERARGGSRSGMAKFIGSQVNGTSPVQHIAVLIDPEAPSLNADVYTSTDAPTGYVLDPSTNNTFPRNFGRYLAPGGSGRQPFPMAPQSQQQDNGTGQHTLTFNGLHLSGDPPVILGQAVWDMYNGAPATFNFFAFPDPNVFGAPPPPSGAVWFVLSNTDYNTLANASSGVQYLCQLVSAGYVNFFNLTIL
jgi:hypothetical protein